MTHGPDGSETRASPSPGSARIDERGAVALVIADTIGTGVFTTSGFALGDLGAPSFVMPAWAAGGLHALCGVVAYADLAAKIPVSCGGYAFAGRHPPSPDRENAHMRSSRCRKPPADRARGFPCERFTTPPLQKSVVPAAAAGIAGLDEAKRWES